jgi:uncharacterized iron-regulated membrane protein
MRLPARLWFRRLHLVLGLALGAVLVCVAGSGAALVFRDEIRGLSPADRVAPDSPELASAMGFAAARDLARAARPGHELQILWFPNEARPYYEAAYRTPDGAEFAVTHRFHPVTGESLPLAESPILDWIEHFHVDLHLGEVGAFLVRWCTLLFALVLLSGLYLWWPGLKPLLWFAVRRGKLRLWDAHRVLGFVAAVPLLLMMFSGLVFAFPAASALVYLSTGKLPPPAATQDLYALRSTPPADPGATPAPEASDEALLAAARALSPADAFLFYLTFPLAPDDHRQVRLQRGYSPFPFGEVHRVFFDQYSGAVLGHLRPADTLADRYLSATNSELHYGTLGGLATQLLWFAACALVPFFAVTGVLLWRRRASARAARSFIQAS